MKLSPCIIRSLDFQFQIKNTIGLKHEHLAFFGSYNQMKSHKTALILNFQTEAYFEITNVHYIDRTRVVCTFSAQIKYCDKKDTNLLL